MGKSVPCQGTLLTEIPGKMIPSSTLPTPHPSCSFLWGKGHFGMVVGVGEALGDNPKITGVGSVLPLQPRC